MRSQDRFPVYPFLFPIYSILALHVSNAEETSVQSCVKPALISIAATLVMLLFGRLVFRSYRKAGIASSVMAVLFFSYGHIVDALMQAVGKGFRVGLLTFPVWIGLILLTLAMLARTRRQLDGVAGFLRTVSLVLVAISLVQTVSVQVGKRGGPRHLWARYVSETTTGRRLQPPPRESMPDIYYIIMDAYSRADVLKQVFDFDNSSFTDFLTSKGFYVAAQSKSNYKSTPLSVGSSMNMGYLQDLVRESGLSRKRPDHLHMLANPKVVGLLRQAGYAIVQIQSEYEAFKLLESDIALRKGAVISSEFDRVLRDTTVLRVLTKLGPSSVASDRDVVLAELDYLEQSPEIPSPKFVYAHITTTHSPFYVRADGSAPDRVVQWVRECGWEAYKAAYVESLQYANKRLISIVTAILDRSRVPPIIVIQADHGGRWDGPILNAYHLPDGGDQDLYPSISPVNTFRVVFNRYLGGKFELLEDRTYQQHEVRKGALVYTFTPDKGETNLQ